jgi:hypothetical protein
MYIVKIRTKEGQIQEYEYEVDYDVSNVTEYFREEFPDCEILSIFPA